MAKLERIVDCDGQDGTAPPAVDRALTKPSPSLTWVPIRTLAARHRPRALAHLLALNERDRYLRFGFAASDSQVSSYVDKIDFERDDVFGIFNYRLELVALAHLAYPAQPSAAVAELGVSLLERYRGRGFGTRLFDRAVLHARNRGIDNLAIHALSENTAMLRIAKNAGATVERMGSESEAHLKLPPESIATQLGQLFETAAAEFDYQLKAQSNVAQRWVEFLHEVTTSITEVESSSPR
jgi:RimJ/RimL family protein N-acetyltransferase